VFAPPRTQRRRCRHATLRLPIATVVTRRRDGRSTALCSSDRWSATGRGCCRRCRRCRSGATHVTSGNCGTGSTPPRLARSCR